MFDSNYVFGKDDIVLMTLSLFFLINFKIHVLYVVDEDKTVYLMLDNNTM